MSAEGNLFDPSIFAPPPPIGQEGREYWRGRDGKGGYRCDAVLRRYLDIVYRHVLGQEPPARQPLFLPSDIAPEYEKQGTTGLNGSANAVPHERDDAHNDLDDRPAKRQKHEKKEAAHNDTSAPSNGETTTPKKSGKPERTTNTNLTAMQAHCFHILRALVGEDTSVRDALAHSRAGDLNAYENVLSLAEAAVKKGLLEYERNPAKLEDPEDDAALAKESSATESDCDPLNVSSSLSAVRRCKRPFWVCQSRVRPLPQEALEKGSLQLSKKEKKKLAAAAAEVEKEAKAKGKVGLHDGGTVGVEERPVGDGKQQEVEVAREGLLCG
jgi:tRNA-dihydrouridine synthase 1